MWNCRPIAVVTVLYITVNIHSHPRPVVMVTNNFTGLILFRVGCGDLGMYFSNKLSP